MVTPFKSLYYLPLRVNENFLLEVYGDFILGVSPFGRLLIASFGNLWKLYFLEAYVYSLLEIFGYFFFFDTSFGSRRKHGDSLCE